MECSKQQEIHTKILLFIIPFLIGTGVDLYVPSLPAITSYFHVSKDLVQLTIAFYMLGYGVGQIFFGVLSDCIGRKKVVLLSVFLYTVVSFLSVFASTIYILIGFRLIQGLCIAGLGTLCRAIATDCFQGVRLAKVMTFISISFALGPIVGPFIGGYLEYFFNWQANFYYFAIYGALISVYASFYLRESNQYLQKFDVKQVARNIYNVITHPIFILITLVASLVYSGLVMFNIIGPFIIQVGLKYTAVQYGHLALLIGFGYFLGNLLNRVVISYVAPMKVAFVALCGALLCAVILLYLGVFFKENIYLLLVPILCMFFMFGLLFPNTMAKAVSYFPKSAGTASALFGTSLGVIVFVVTSFSSGLKATTQTPMAIVYVSLLSVCMLLFVASTVIRAKAERVKECLQ